MKSATGKHIGFRLSTTISGGILVQDAESNVDKEFKSREEYNQWREETEEGREFVAKTSRL